MSLSTLQPQTSLIKFPDYYEFRASCSRQSFSLPESMIYYISRNPLSPKVYQKLVRTCKYFFIKNSILIFHCLYLEDGNWKTCSIKKCYGRPETCKYRKIDCDLRKVQGKIWIHCRLHISSSESNIASSIISKIYNADVKKLHLDGQNITFNDLLFLSKKLRQIKLYQSYVFYENRVEVPYEIVLANLPIITYFLFKNTNQFYDFSNTVKEILKIPHFKNLKAFVGFGLNESFDIVTFFEYLKRNTQTKVSLTFFAPLSEEYKQELAIIVDEILFAELPRSYIPPFIGYDGQLRIINYALYNLCKSYD
uniref:Uncharacterized protein n=1 Tax=Panagrolaimus davidi TaxID=227884 RepID=A0A914PA28_9BILA